MNKIIAKGYLTREPQLSYMPSQTAVVDFGLALNRRWKTPGGEQKEEVCFVDCRAFGKRAETINMHLHKGEPVLIEGRLTFDTWTGQDGAKHSKHRITVEGFEFIGTKTKEPASGEGDW